MNQWLQAKSTNFNIFYKPKSLAQKHIRDIVKKEEIVLRKLQKFLDVKNSRKINLYLYPSLASKKKELGGKSPASARFRERRLAYVYSLRFPSVACAHEETHILCFRWNKNKPTSYIENQDLISTASFYEGLAIYTQSLFFNKYFYKYSLIAKPPKGMTLNQSIKQDVLDNNVPTISEILMYEGYCSKLKNGGQLGSIVKFLIESYGLNKFKNLFVKISEDKTLKDNELVFQKVYAKTITKLNEEWKKYVILSND
ncbi:hypothetical protein A2160_03735 [Candidatus Beckwithbacteria bacterium RBG_13_42_9]|uniref:DUF1570 domain-containing protein n=1 Tax=Candidatus Beckwithbacteria bacterium RBG_13_42_9 TaxID=1797457 RepID=A0A1F5E8L7_9BACT|nr:MAG: hypothetical protein A2160_03735 [Candidatus Beckwithbacteria bacterium RBG_13_42_9]